MVGLDASRAARTPGGPNPPPTFTAINNAFASQLNAQDLGDHAPTVATLARYASTCRELATLVAAWQRVSTTELVGFNALLTKRGKTAIVLQGAVLRAPGCT